MTDIAGLCERLRYVALATDQTPAIEVASAALLREAADALSAATARAEMAEASINVHEEITAYRRGKLLARLEAAETALREIRRLLDQDDERGASRVVHAALHQPEEKA